MGRKVFVSYKYADSDVAPLFSVCPWTETTARSYVDVFIEKVKSNGIAVYKGEMENEDLSGLSNEAIWARLKDKIYDSSVTVVFLSPGMRVQWQSDQEQWIPWEISYSLKEVHRKYRTSGTNSLVLVILPDKYGNYFYVNNMTHFNIVSANINNGYAEVVQWNQFVGNISYYIERANQRKNAVPSNKIVKTV